MSETSFLDQIFPIEGEPEPDYLAGMQDFTHGVAEDFFKSLSDDDRELTQWFLMQGMNPLYMEECVTELATDYALVDPSRNEDMTRELAHIELARIRRFINIFLASDAFFPIVAMEKVPVTNDLGQIEERMYVEGWGEYDQSEIDLSSGSVAIEGLTGIDIVHVLDLADSFIDDPRAGMPVFNQGAIIFERNERMSKLHSGVEEVD